MSLVSVNAEDLATVLELACLIESRDDSEQRSLMKVAEKCDRKRNAQTVTNPRWQTALRGEWVQMSELERAVHRSRAELEDGQRYVKPSWERKRRRA